MKTVSYFYPAIEKHGVSQEEVRTALRNEVERETQPYRSHSAMGMARTSRGLYLRVILLPDGETLFNAFPDSNFTRKRGRP
jgi:hypothetical protein